jgi:diadenosine tetraphosphatase ApaH/serine/threonine PP2A family protein phosphatase
MFRNTAFTGDAAAPVVVGYGDIHVSYVKRMDGRTLFNAGSVGNPLDATKASYAIVSAFKADSPAPSARAGRSVLDVEIVKLDYDIERAVAEAKSSGMPELEPWIRELVYAEYRGQGKITAEA